MGRSRQPAIGKVVAALNHGPQTMLQIARRTGLSTRTVETTLDCLIASKRVRKIDLFEGHRGNLVEQEFPYPRDASRVFYQLELFSESAEPLSKVSILIRQGGRYRSRKLYHKGRTPVGEVMLGYSEEKKKGFYVKRPWMGEDVRG